MCLVYWHGQLLISKNHCESLKYLTVAFWFQIKVAMMNKIVYNLAIIIGIQLIVTQTNR